MPSITFDYTNFADEQVGMVPYLAECVKVMIRNNDKDGLQKMMNDVATLRDSLDELNDDIAAKYDKYLKKLKKLEALNQELRAREEARVAIEKEMAEEFGTPEEEQEEPKDEVEMELNAILAEDDTDPSENDLFDIVLGGGDPVQGSGGVDDSSDANQLDIDLLFGPLQPVPESEQVDAPDTIVQGSGTEPVSSATLSGTTSSEAVVPPGREPLVSEPVDLSILANLTVDKVMNQPSGDEAQQADSGSGIVLQGASQTDESAEQSIESALSEIDGLVFGDEIDSLAQSIGKEDLTGVESVDNAILNAAVLEGGGTEANEAAYEDETHDEIVDMFNKMSEETLMSGEDDDIDEYLDGLVDLDGDDLVLPSGAAPQEEDDDAPVPTGGFVDPSLL